MRHSKLPALRTGHGAAVNQIQSADRDFLSEIWYGDSHYGIALTESKLEKEVKMARNGLPNAPETVIVAMR
jgi:hypothetical protein